MLILGAIIIASAHYYVCLLHSLGIYDTLFLKGEIILVLIVGKDKYMSPGANPLIEKNNQR